VNIGLLLSVHAIACGSTPPNWWDAAATSPTPPTGTLGSGIVSVVVNPPALNGGGVSLGRITIDRDAPPGGAVVQLSSSDVAAQVPATLTIPAGTRSMTFAVTTRTVPNDLTVEIAGFVSGASGRTTLSVYAMLPNAFTWISDPADAIWRGRYGRVTSMNATFLARCERDELWVQISSPVDGTSLIQLGAPRGTPMRSGTYEGATRTAFRAPGVPGIDIGINGTGCNTTNGRFVVSELDFGATGQVNKFVATFEQLCQGSPTPVRGELRLTGPFTPPPFSVSCIR